LESNGATVDASFRSSHGHSAFDKDVSSPEVCKRTWYEHTLSGQPIRVVSQTEGVGCRIETADLKNASGGSNATNRSVLYSTRKT
jgi:hypothetical protein